ncbi:UNKNOWN [Stylonychia lemnae]|uniref:Uncharacterized protein n=1 Tax=Stylonychia lemnae TaxID=5949 RepID=A0A078ABE9_STYLE|nr:UNKNOWN [Stylonychia lemnae]|eukprot:CDW79504.1 UNKNOWN [Stylonychia lemnae]
MSQLFINTAKATFYGPNGTGRDTYIYNNNGGLTAGIMQNVQPPVGTLVSPIKKHIAVNKPVIHSRSIQYHSNGSGRDSYIVRGQGGFQIDSSPGAQSNSFYNSLRQYDPNQRYIMRRSGSNSPSGNMTSPTTNSKKNPFKDYLVEGQNTYSNGQVKHQLNALNMYQKQLDSRLSQPKYSLQQDGNMMEQSRSALNITKVQNKFQGSSTQSIPNGRESL